MGVFRGGAAAAAVALLAASSAVAGLAPALPTAGGIILDSDTAMLATFGLLLPGVDAGFDIDDDLALIYLTSAGADVLGVTSTFGNSAGAVTHADAERLLGMLPSQKARAYAGAGYLSRHGETDASRFIAAAVRNATGPVTVLCVGAMSNLATALRADPGLAANLGAVVLLGGNLDANETLVTDLESSANFYFDLRSTEDVLRLTPGVPKVVLPVQTIVRAAVTSAVVARLNCSGAFPSWRGSVHPHLEPWRASHAPKMRRNFGGLPGFAPGGFFPWDVHAAALAVRPALYGDYARYNMSVGADLRVVFEPAPLGGNVVVPRSIDAGGFIDSMVGMLCAA